MNAIYATMADDSTASRILSLIERHAPRLMRAGGGSLRRDCPARTKTDGSTQWDQMGRWKRITPEQRAQIIAMGLAGSTRKEIEIAVGATQSSVYKILEHEGVKVQDGRAARYQKERGA